MLKRLHEIRGSDAALKEMQFARPFANIGKDLRSKSSLLKNSVPEVDDGGSCVQKSSNVDNETVNKLKTFPMNISLLINSDFI